MEKRISTSWTYAACGVLELVFIMIEFAPQLFEQRRGRLTHAVKLDIGAPLG